MAVLGGVVAGSRPRRIRRMGQFAEEEIVLPNGPFALQKYRLDRQPYSRLYFAAVDSGLWNEFVFTGPSQSGKTLTGSVIPCVYHLFEIEEDVIFGLPDMGMAGDKWRKDIKPVIEASRFKPLLPTSGGGSRGGKVEAIDFRNGCTLRFMSAGGGDASRAGYTSRVVVLTEVDSMCEASDTSDESNPINQFRARTRAYDEYRRIYMECTLTTAEGVTWRSYESGTASVIVLPCFACGRLVTPDREHLHGWQDAEDELSAKRRARFHCPACGAGWTEAQRKEANLRARLVHKGQVIGEDGNICGEPEPVGMLGFRFTAANNLMVSAGTLGTDEWKGKRELDEDDAEKNLCQFVWGRVYVPPVTDMSPLDPKKLEKRMSGALTQGLVAEDTEYLAVGTDVGKWWLDSVAPSWRAGALGHVVDYWRTEVPSHDMDEEVAILAALRELRDQLLSGWPVQGADGARLPGAWFIDAGYQPSVVYAFCRECVELEVPFEVRPCKGWGAAKRYGQSGSYSHPKTKHPNSPVLGEEYHFRRIPEERLYRVNFNADYWKLWLWRRFRTPAGEAGSMALFETKEPHFHMDYTLALTSEKQVETFVPGKGPVITWEVVRRNKNHKLDASVLGCVALHRLGARLVTAGSGELAAAGAGGAGYRKKERRREGDGGGRGGRGGWQVGR